MQNLNNNPQNNHKAPFTRKEIKKISHRMTRVEYLLRVLQMACYDGEIEMPADVVYEITEMALECLPSNEVSGLELYGEDDESVVS